MRKKIFFLFPLVIIALAAVLLIFNVQKRQTGQSHASAATSLFFSPLSSRSYSIVRRVGDAVSLNVFLNPGNNYISTVKMHITFDPSIFKPTEKKTLIANKAVFPSVIDEPFIENGNVTETLAIGPNPTIAIKKPVKIATLNLIAIAPTDGDPSIISFKSDSQAFSISPSDYPYENVIATALPAYIIIIPPNPSIVPISIPPANISTTSAQLTSTPTPQPSNTVLTVSASLDGIGNRKDSQNKDLNNLNNNNPLHKNRKFTLAVYNAENQLVTSQNGVLNYNDTDGTFTGTFDLGGLFNTGYYSIKITTPNHLQRTSLENIHIIAGSQQQLPPVSFAVGDVNDDQKIDILDFNLLSPCFNNTFPPSPCSNQTKSLADLNDDGKVDQVDGELFLKEILSGNGGSSL